MPKSPCIDIAMAVYNAEEFLPEQLRSIQEQDYPHWKLIIRDDGSQDRTCTIVKDFQASHPDKVIILEGGPRLGGCGNFSKLMSASHSNYLMFADCDDVWLPEKIRITLVKMQELENTFGREKPLLVHTNLQVVDRNLNFIHESFACFQYLRLEQDSLSKLLIRNTVTGCTVMINKPLRTLASPIPQEAVMHDWWIALVASALGKMTYLDKATMLYRQHGRNTVGAKAWGWRRIIDLASRAPYIKERMILKQQQSQAFWDRYHDRLDSRNESTVSNLACLSSHGYFMRRYLLFRHGLLETSWIRNLGMLLHV